MRVEKASESRKESTMMSCQSDDETDSSFDSSSIHHCDHLKDELQETAEKCRFIAEKLVQAWQQKSTCHKAIQTETSFKKMKTELQESQAVIMKLKQNISDLTEANSRWQRYSDTRDDQVRMMKERIESQERTIQALKTEEKQPRADSVNDASSSELLLLLRVYAHVQAENDKLKAQLRAANQKCESLMMDREDCNLHKIQANINAEDFEAERKEKEAAQTRLKQFMQELSNFKSKYRQLKDRLSQLEERYQFNDLSSGVISQPLRCSNCSGQKGPVIFFSPCDVPYTCKVTPAKDYRRQPRLWQRGPGEAMDTICDGPSDMSTITSDAPVLPTAPSLRILPALLDDNVLECSGCRKKFPSSKHYEFLEHFRSCPSNQMEDQELLNDEVIECSGCSKKFPTNKHIEFLEHFRSCPSNQMEDQELLNDEVIECSGCSKKFPSSKHSEFLEHFRSCPSNQHEPN